MCLIVKTSSYRFGSLILNYFAIVKFQLNSSNNIYNKLQDYCYYFSSKMRSIHLVLVLFVVTIVQNCILGLNSSQPSFNSLQGNSLADSTGNYKECSTDSCEELICAESKISLEKHSATYTWKIEGLQDYVSFISKQDKDFNITSSTKFNSLISHDGIWLFTFSIRSNMELEIHLSYTPTDRQNSSQKLEIQDFAYDVLITAVSLKSNLLFNLSHVEQVDAIINYDMDTDRHLKQLAFVSKGTVFRVLSNKGNIDVTELKFIINAYRLNPTITSVTNCTRNQIDDDEEFLEEEKSNSTLPQIGNLMKNDRYADLIIKSGDEEFKVHRAILANSSPVFATMIFNKTFDKNESLLDLGEKIGSDAVEEILRYIYTGKIEDIDEIADSLIIAAFKYGFPQLKYECESALLKQVGTANAFSMYSLAIEIKAVRLQKKAFKVMKENKTKIVNDTEEFRKLSVHHPEIMYELCLSN